MAVVYEKSAGLTDAHTHYCPGCHHGIIHKLVAEVLVEQNLLESAVGISPVGCSVLAYNYFNCDMQQASHGRAPAVATAIKRLYPQAPVFTYQGDGDLASIGMGEIVHAAMRGEKFTTIFVNNAIYGMTGGQMAPTTLPGQVTQTSPYGRDTDHCGFPVKVCEILSQLDGAAYLERVTVNNVKHVKQAKKAIKKAFQNQLDGKGFSLIEVVSTCPTNWGMTPKKSMEWIDTHMLPTYPLGVYKDITKEEG